MQIQITTHSHVTDQLAWTRTHCIIWNAHIL